MIIITAVDQETVAYCSERLKYKRCLLEVVCDEGKWRVTVAMEQSRQAPNFSMSNLEIVEVISGCSPPSVNMHIWFLFRKGML